MPETLNSLLNDSTWPAQSKSAAGLAPVFRFRLVAWTPASTDWGQTPAQIVGREVEAANRVVSFVRAPDGVPIPGQLLFPLNLSFESADVRVSFPWWDTFQEMTSFFEWLREGKEGSHWSDVDQGWLFKAARLGAQLHFLDSAFDQGDELVNVSVDRTAFLGRLDVAERDARTMLTRLEVEFARRFAS